MVLAVYLKLPVRFIMFISKYSRVCYGRDFLYTYLASAGDRHLNPLSPHDALKHHFTSLKTDLIFLQPRVLE